jgi:hypothetical protein
MHARGKGPGPDEKKPGAPARTATPGTADAVRLAAAGNLSPQAAVALQRSAGNAALAASLQRETREAQEKHQHGAGCGHGDQIQRSAVPDVLRAPGSPLDTAVRTDMESRLGADFSDVRLHTGSAAKASAAEVGARAYTSGSHVVIGDGGADSHTLAHELTHVIQQRQGPVAGTDNGSGLKVSDPSDRFEREAEANATRVMQRAVEPAGLAEGMDAPVAGGTGSPSVQRAKEATRPQVTMPNGETWDAHNDPGRADGGLVLSGHGSWDKADMDFKVPSGTRVHLYTTHGTTVLDSDGGVVETGGDLAPLSVRTGIHTVPDYELHPPDGLSVHGSPVAVTPLGGGKYSVQLDPTQAAAQVVNSLRDPLLAGRSITVTRSIHLSQLLVSGMGNVHFAACLHLDIPAMRGRTRNQS